MSPASLPAEQLAERSRPRHGVLTVDDALACGLSPEDVRRMVTQGWWKVVHPGVMVPSGVPLTALVREHAALAYYGNAAQLSHTSAAAHHRLEVATDNRVFVSVPFTSPFRPRPGVQLMRTRHPLPPQRVDGLAVTFVPRTVVDLARDLDRTCLLKVVADAVRRRRTSLERILAMAEGMGGRAGIALLRQVCDEVDPAFESQLEEEALPHLTAAGLVVVRQLEVVDDQGRFVARLDFAVEELRLAVEIDGWGYHSSPDARSRDSRRDRRLTVLGWTVLRFTTDDVRQGSARMVKDLREAADRLRKRAA